MSDRILCIDPGPEASGIVLIDSEGSIHMVRPSVENEVARGYAALRDSFRAEYVVIEMVESYGMAVGADVFRTCVEIGRFVQLADTKPGRVHLLGRKDVKIELCGSMRAKDANIRQAILDRYPATGGGKVPQVGTKAYPGPLYGVSKHAWSALGLGLAWLQRRQEGRL